MRRSPTSAPPESRSSGELKTGAASIQADLRSIQAALGELESSESGDDEDDFVEIDDDIDTEPDPGPAREPEPDPEPEPEPEPEPAAAPSGDWSDGSEGARLIALNMALNGTPREETAQYLRENFDVADEDALLDDVYARAGQA